MFLAARHSAPPALALLLGCATLADDVGYNEESGTAATTTHATSAGEPTDADSSEEGTTEPPSNFLATPDGGPRIECDTWAQDCPAGYKCNPWASSGGSVHDAAKCVAMVPNPAKIGEPCTMGQDALDGVDTCGVGAMCWWDGFGSDIGICREFCTGSDSNWACADPQFRCGGNRFFPICLPSCCPLLQDCDDGEGCYPDHLDFRCFPDVGDKTGAYADPCEFLNVCDPGLLCVGSAAFPDCDGSTGCCTHFCELGSSDCDGLGATVACLPWFDEGEAPPGLDHVGVCAIEER